LRNKGSFGALFVFPAFDSGPLIRVPKSAAIIGSEQEPGEIMTDTTENLALPYIMGGQAQKHVTHNESLKALDAIINLSVLSRTLGAPPLTLGPGARYIVAAVPTGVWVGKAGMIAAFQHGAWAFYAPQQGWLAFVVEEEALCVFDGTEWTSVAGEALPRLGINTSADDTNRLAVASAATLFTHVGSNHRLSINKAAGGDTASVVMSSGYSGRAEMGLAGDDHFHFKVSADGAIWKEALRIDSATGVASFPSGSSGMPRANLLLNGDCQINQRMFGGGVLGAGAFGYDRWKALASGATITKGTAITLNAGGIGQVVEPDLFGLVSFAGLTVTASVETLSGGNLTIAFGSKSGTLTPSAREATFTLTGSDTGVLLFSLAVASGTPVFSKIKLEVGGNATPTIFRPLPEELRLCQRYFETSVPAGQNPATYAPGGGGSSLYLGADTTDGSISAIRFLVPKRAAPTMTIRDGAANAARISGFSTAWANNLTFVATAAVTDKGFSISQANAGLHAIAFDYVASAEL
jgi:hypothetical protein